MNRKPLLALFLALALVGCDLEAMSKLSKECRLPAFFTIPAGFARSDLTVEQKVYTDGHRDFSLQD